jgi:hypothetical protein
MRQIDVSVSTEARVRELPDRPYIATMCVVTDVLNCLYEDFISEKAGRVIRQTIDVGKASLRGDLNSGEIALSVFLSMEAIRDDPKYDPPPLVDAMHAMVWIFAGEISGEIPLREAPSCLGSAVSTYNGNIEEPKPSATAFDEADESSPDVRLLRGFWRAADLADSVVPLDSDAIRREVFGEERQALIDKLLGDGLR